MCGSGKFASTLSNRGAFSQVFPFILLTTVLIISVVKSSLALSLGLVNEVVTADQVMATARNYARKILQCAPLAIRATKHCALQGLKYNSVEEVMAAQLDHRFDKLETMMHSEDIREGLQAFMDKRKPQWAGR